MVDLPVPKRVWLFPGELVTLLEKNGIWLDANAPLASETALGYKPTIRSTADMLVDIEKQVSRDDLAHSLHSIANPTNIIRIKRGARRQPVEHSYACAGAEDEGILLLNTRQDDGTEILFSFTLETLSIMLSGCFVDIQIPDLPLDTFIPLSPAGVGALLALADLFNQIYPIPDPHWQPEVPLLFSLDSWYQLLQTSLNSPPQESLVSAFQNLTGISIPAISKDELVSILLVFINEGYIAVRGDQLPCEPNAVYIAGNELLFTLRCMAWWDLSLGIEKFPNSTNTGTLPFYAFQASVIWQFIPIKNTQQILIRAIHGQQLIELVSSILHRTFSYASYPPDFSGKEGNTVMVRRSERGSKQRKSPESPVKRTSSDTPVLIHQGKRPASPNPVPPPSSAVKPAPAKVNTCPVCGKRVSSSSRFCRYCGAAVPEFPPFVEQIRCPNCNQIIPPGVAFCRYCGQKIN